MAKKKVKAEAWAVVNETIATTLYDSREEAVAAARTCDGDMPGFAPFRVVRLVPHDPKKEAVYRAAVDLIAWHDPEGKPKARTLSQAEQRLRRAVERAKKGG